MLNILVVTDSSGLASIMEKWLKMRGYKAISACNVRNAIKKLNENESINLLLTDFMLDNGVTSKNLIKLASSKGIPSLIMTGYCNVDIIFPEFFVDLDINPKDDVLYKPLTMDEVDNKIKSKMKIKPVANKGIKFSCLV